MIPCITVPCIHYCPISAVVAVTIIIQLWPCNSTIFSLSSLNHFPEFFEVDLICKDWIPLQLGLQIQNRIRNYPILTGGVGFRFKIPVFTGDVVFRSK